MEQRNTSQELSTEKGCAILLAIAVAFALVVVLLGGCPRSRTVKSRPAPDPTQQAERKRLIDELTSRGIFYKVVKPADTPHVWVTPLFKALSYDDKQNFVSVVCAYYDSDMVTLKDSSTGNRIGYFSRDMGLSISE